MESGNGGEAVTVYADVLFVVNAVVNYLLLAASARLGGGQLRRGRLLAAGCAGGVYGVAALVRQLAFLRTAGMKLTVLALMLLCAFGARRRTLRLGVLFLALSFAFAGLVLLSAQVFGGGLLLMGSGAYYPVSLPALLLLAALAYLVSELAFSRLAEHGGGEIIPLTLTLGGRSVELNALRDTGNTLRDPITNERVLVISWEAAERLMPEAGLERMRALPPDAVVTRLAACCPAARPRLIPYRAVGTQAGLLAAIRCTAQVKGGRSGQTLAALSPTPVSDGGNYDALTGGVL